MADEYSGAGGIYPSGSFYSALANRLSTLEETVGTSLGAVTAAQQAQAAATAANEAATNAQETLDTVIASTANIAAEAAAAAEEQVNTAAAAALASAQAAADAAAADVSSSAAAALADAQAAALSAEASAQAAGNFDPANYYQKTETEALIAAGGVPIGASIMWNTDDALPEGFLKENGAEYSRTVYHELFAAIGTKHGAGDGSTTFNVPESRGEFVRGWDDGRGIDAGRELGSWQDSANKSHDHEISDPGHSHVVPTSPIGSGNSSTGRYVGGSTLTSYTNSAKTGITILADGGDEARPRNVAKLFLIRAY